MRLNHGEAPSPLLRIVPMENLHPHEEHDSQRSQPLIERLRHEREVINPPIVAPMGDEQYVVLDGANRCFSLAHLGYPHMLVQVVSYEEGYVDLQTWRHVICDWNKPDFLHHIAQLERVQSVSGIEDSALAQIHFADDEKCSLCAQVNNLHERNRILRAFVKIYQTNATLHRTASSSTEEVWDHYPDGAALVTFPHYTPADIINASHEKAYLPPGISRHVVYGRAIRVNYPLAALADRTMSLDAKNENLKAWMQQKLAKRQVRYYAEATYQFDE